MKSRGTLLIVLLLVLWVICQLYAAENEPARLPGRTPSSPPGESPQLATTDASAPPLRIEVPVRPNGTATVLTSVLVLCDGSPLPGASLFLCTNPNRSQLPHSEALGSSNPEGWIDVPATAARRSNLDASAFVVAKNGFSSELVAPPDAAGRSVVSLRTAEALRVRCVMAIDDMPIAGVVVAASRNSISDNPVPFEGLPGPAADWRLVSAVTDDRGVAVLRGVEPGRYVYRVMAPDGLLMVEGPVRLSSSLPEVVCRFERAVGSVIDAGDRKWIATQVQVISPQARTGGQRLARLSELRRAAATRFGQSGSQVVIVAFAGEAGTPRAQFEGLDNAGNHVKKTIDLKPLENGLPVLERTDSADVVGQVPLSKVALAFFGPTGKPVEVGDLVLSSVATPWRHPVGPVQHVHELLLPQGSYRLDSPRHALALALPQNTIDIAASPAQEMHIHLQEQPTRVTWSMQLPSDDPPRLLALEILTNDGRPYSRGAVPAVGYDWLPQGDYTMRFSAGDAASLHSINIAGQEVAALNGVLRAAERR